MWIRQEAHVESEVLLARGPVLEAEAHERERQAPGGAGAAAARRRCSQRSIAADMPVVSITRSARERSGSSRARSEATPAATLPWGASGMAAAGLLIARGRASARRPPRTARGESMPSASRSSITAVQRLEVNAAAHVGDNGGALDLGALVNEQLDQRADHLRGEIVHAEVAGVLEHVHRRGLAGARIARDDNEVLQTRHDRRSACRLGRHGPCGGHLSPLCSLARGNGPLSLLDGVARGYRVPSWPVGPAPLAAPRARRRGSPRASRSG